MASKYIVGEHNTADDGVGANVMGHSANFTEEEVSNIYFWNKLQKSFCTKNLVCFFDIGKYFERNGYYF